MKRAEEVEQLNETLQSLRVAMPGLQMLFAFLLAIPFAQRFAETTATQRAAYAVDLACTALSSIFLIAPAIYHSLTWRHESEELADRLRRFNQLTLVGGVFLLFALVASMFLVFDFLFGRVAGVSMAAAIGLICAACWYGLPLLRKGRMGETNGAERR